VTVRERQHRYLQAAHRNVYQTFDENLLPFAELYQRGEDQDGPRIGYQCGKSDEKEQDEEDVKEEDEQEEDEEEDEEDEEEDEDEDDDDNAYDDDVSNYPHQSVHNVYDV